MKFKKVSIKNFRKLEDISFDCASNITTIVGPNGIGKSSILDAIRIVKAVLLPSSKDEMQQSLQFLGVFSPHVGQILVETIAGDLTKPVTMDLRIEVSQEEIALLKQDLHNFNILRLQNRIGQNNLASINLIAFLSSPVGSQQLSEVQKETEKFLEEFEKTNIAQIKFQIFQNQANGFNGFHQELISYLFRSPIFSETLFTVFTADRNFPTGDTNIQLGQNEIGQQLQSYSIQPQAKFARLKAAIISFIMINGNNISPIQNDFKLIFDSLIPGKELAGISLEERTGRLSVLIKETGTSRVYDIDFLSSGEKGLLLTLFLLLRTVRERGIIILDEPELHLNPAVCKNIIPFLKKYICDEKKAQIILTTHSAEILADTKESNDCQLLHLIDAKTISPIYKNDNEEAQEAIKGLGITTSDLLFNKGVVYLEGTTDDEYIYEVLKGVVDGFKIQSLGGRSIVENEIKVLQEADKRGELKGFHIFVIDFDNKPTSLTSTNNVNVIQWDRYSFENYLLNLTYLYDVVKDDQIKNFPSNRGEFNKRVKELAFSQIESICVYNTIEKLTPKTISASKPETKSKNIEEISQLFSDKVDLLKNSLSSFNKTFFEQEFKKDYEQRKAEMELDWEENWKVKCKGKDLLTFVFNEYGIRNYKKFIKDLIAINKGKDSDEWKILKAKLHTIISKK